MKRIVLLGVLSLTSAAYAGEAKHIGETLYNKACSNCHESSKAKGMGAPAAFDPVAWEAQIKKAKMAIAKEDKFKTVDDYFLYQIRIGRGLMHHGGLCKETKALSKDIDCSDKAYLAAIAYMSQSKK